MSVQFLFDGNKSNTRAYFERINIFGYYGRRVRLLLRRAVQSYDRILSYQMRILLWKRLQALCVWECLILPQSSHIKTITRILTRL
jgi:hypothetical protein